MGIFTRLLERRSQTFMDVLLSSRGPGFETATGKKVTVHNSLQVSTVFACQRILAEGVASLPLVLYRRLARGKERATNHRLFDILHTLPNPELTSYELRELVTSHTALWGNGYLEIQRDQGARVMALWPLRPDRVDVQRGWDGQLYYVVTIGDPLEHNPETQILPARNVMHIRGLGYDGVKGLSVVGLARQSIGLAMATEEFGARFFGNGARPGMVLEHPGKLSGPAEQRLRKSWNKEHQGLSMSHRVAILEEGMKLHEVGIPPEDAQFLETRKFQVTDISRWFRIPPHMVADLEHATFSNIEHLGLEFVIYTLGPWLMRIEQATSRDLLTPEERKQYFAEHLVNALLRGDIKSRYEAYSQGRQNGWLSANDIREMENMNPVEGGDVYLVPLNMVPADLVGGGGQRSAGSNQETRSLDIEERARVENLVTARRRLRRSYERLIQEAVDRVIRREIADVRRALGKYLRKRDAFQFATWLKQFYEEHREFWQRQILPVLLSYADQVGASVADELGGDAQTAEDIRAFIDQYAEALATREVGSGHLQLQAILDEKLQAGEDPEPALQERLDEWEEKRAGKITRGEVVGALSAFSLAFYQLVGVRHKRWVKIGDSCPYCSSLDGRVVEIEKFFLEKDTDFQPDGADKPISVRYNVGHAPAHDGCDCLIIADI